MDSSRVGASIGSSPIASRSAVGADDVAVVTDATDHDHGDDDDDDDAPRASQLGRFKLLEAKRKPHALILAQELFASYVCWPVSWYLSSAPLSFLARSPVLGKRIRDRKSIGISAKETEIYRDSAVTVAAPAAPRPPTPALAGSFHQPSMESNVDATCRPAKRSQLATRYLFNIGNSLHFKITSFCSSQQ